jgi:hypothetical protein
MSETKPLQFPDYQWVKHRDKDEWSLYASPYELIIVFRPKEALPYVGSVKGAFTVYRDLRAWATAEEAAVGMIAWALEEVTDAYQKLMRLLPQQPQQPPPAGK